MSLARSAARPALATLAQSSAVAPARNMATLREIEMRLKSVKNIEKITKSMKMIASTRLAKAQRAMNQAKVYGEANNEVFKTAEAPKDGKKLIVVVSSDRGLCGGIHSSVTKYTRRYMREEGQAEAPLVVLGDKSKAQLGRVFANNMAVTFNQVGKDIPTFADAAVIADFIVKSGAEYDSLMVVYNRFISAMSYEAGFTEVVGEVSLREAESFKVYEMEEDATKDLAEFSIANAIYAALVEGHAAEISSRRNAMDNATKNANDMIASLQLKYNRGRQAAITNDLVDIITGANAL
ncbi:ATP synthase F1 gamma [Clavulina sp. PMI_390]|nr:ATP synthase F1 gamma [Clavulina sp. PMI_390]